MSEQWTVKRSGRATRISSGVLVLIGIALFAVPLGFRADVVQQLTTLWTLLIMAVMWNVLAGYGGLVSVGQQAFIGFGAYGTVFIAQARGPPSLSGVAG